MKAKQIQLLRILLEKSNPCTANDLANQLAVSMRSIKTYIQEINKENPQTVSSSHMGYTIDKGKALDLLDASDAIIPQTSEERVSYIINQIIRKPSVNVYDLCEEIFISYSTLKNELIKVKKLLSSVDLQLSAHSNQITVKGLEKNKRLLLSQMLYDESAVNFVDFNMIADSFSQIDVDFIHSTVVETFMEYRYFINDYSLANLVLHITIAVDRIISGFINISEQQIPKNFVKLHERQLAIALVKKLENHFNIILNDGEIDDLTLLIISRATNVDYRDLNKNNLIEVVGEECFELVVELVNQTNAYFYIDLSESQFMMRFALHIRNLLVRFKTNYFSKNPLTQSIKRSCPLIYESAVHIANTIYQRYGVMINDDETAYIAFHLGSALEIQRRLTSRISVIIYCPDYYDMNANFSDYINQHFGESIIIMDVFAKEEELENVHCDLIIATVPMIATPKSDYIVINPFLADANQTLISSRIDEIKFKKRQKLFEENLRFLVIPEFFERLTASKDKYALISYMCKKMLTLGYIGATFEKEVIERDNISSTAFNNLALPHAMRMNAKKTGMNVVILDEPLTWDENKVFIVLMMSFNKNERYIFNEVLEPLTQILTDNSKAKIIAGSTNYQDFIQNLVSFLK